MCFSKAESHFASGFAKSLVFKTKHENLRDFRTKVSQDEKWLQGLLRQILKCQRIADSRDSTLLINNECR